MSTGVCGTRPQRDTYSIRVLLDQTERRGVESVLRDKAEAIIRMLGPTVRLYTVSRLRNLTVYPAGR